MKKNNGLGFTLIELLITIVIVGIVTGAIFFCVDNALESWSYSRDELSLQKVLSDTMDKLVVGNPGQFGLKDSLELIKAGRNEVVFVPPWVDDNHSIQEASFIYTLSRRLKPGAALPIVQAKLSESREWRLVPAALVETPDQNATKLKLDLGLSGGGALRFIYHPDAESQPDVTRKIRWDPDSKQVWVENGPDTQVLSANPFGVELTAMELRYYTNANEEVAGREWLDEDEVSAVTAIHVALKARVGERAQTLESFVSLRNAPMRTGYLSLKKGMRLRIADSRHIHTLMITNIAGVSHEDRIEVMAVPRSGKAWRLRAQFEKIGDVKPVVGAVTIEYPPQTVVYTDTPRTTADLGLNLMILDPGGIYDYDDDEGVDDSVLLEGDVEFIVNEMTVKGAGLFVRP